ncbi:MAG: hypothetical protein OXF27_12700 [Acidobacteria bacterium]|nr:hypothetical protein [Acidobacteriota bacterium]
MTTLTIELPDELAEEARRRGLLVSGVIEAMIRDRFRCAAVQELFDTADKLAATKHPPLTLVEIQEEMNATRSQRRPRAART